MNKFIANIMNWVAVVLLFCMVSFLFVQIVARWIFSTGLHWTEELAKICHIMIAYNGAAMTSLNGVHVSVTILSDAMKGVVKKAIMVAHQLIVITFLVLVISFCGEALEIASRSATTNTRINYAILYSIIPISCAIGVFGHFCRILQIITDRGNVRIVDEDLKAERSKEPARAKTGGENQ